MVLRALLERDGEEVDLTLYALLGPAAAIRIVAVSDLGATTFDVTHTAEGASLGQRAGSFPDEALVALAWHLEAFLRPPSDGARLVRGPDGTPLLAARTGAHRFLGAWGTDGLLQGVQTGDGRGLVGEIAYERWARDASGRPTLPGRGHVTLLEAGLRARLDVLRWEPAAVPADAFARRAG